jgi:hypothetical protein
VRGTSTIARPTYRSPVLLVKTSVRIVFETEPSQYTPTFLLPTRTGDHSPPEAGDPDDLRRHHPHPAVEDAAARDSRARMSDAVG